MHKQFTTPVANPTSGHSTLSIVVPAYNEHGNLTKLYSELKQVLLSLDMPCEIIIVDDGSTDDTWNDIKTLHEKDQHVRGIRMS